MIQTLNADILEALDVSNQKTLILHGCNCWCKMGSGIAKYLCEKYPQIYTTDVMTTVKGDKRKLGTFSDTTISDNFHILNCYTQYYYGRDKTKQYADYQAINTCFDRISRRFDTSWEIRMPRIGCGLANGRWEIVNGLVFLYFSGHNVKVYYK